MNKNEEVTDEQLRAWFLSQGYEPDNISTNDYIQKTDDCDWIF